MRARIKREDPPQAGGSSLFTSAGNPTLPSRIPARYVALVLRTIVVSNKIGEECLLDYIIGEFFICVFDERAKEQGKAPRQHICNLPAPVERRSLWIIHFLPLTFFNPFRNSLISSHKP